MLLDLEVPKVKHSHTACGVLHNKAINNNKIRDKTCATVSRTYPKFYRYKIMVDFAGLCIEKNHKPVANISFTTSLLKSLDF